jgi:hypothetical protein
MSLYTLVLSENFTHQIQEDLMAYFDKHHDSRSLASHIMAFSDIFEDFAYKKQTQSFQRIMEHIHMQDFAQVISSPSRHTLETLFGEAQFSFKIQSHQHCYGWFFEFNNQAFLVTHNTSTFDTQRFLIDDCLHLDEQLQIALAFEKAFLQTVADHVYQFCKDYPENNAGLTHCTNMALESKYMTRKGRIKFA